MCSVSPPCLGTFATSSTTSTCTLLNIPTAFGAFKAIINFCDGCVCGAGMRSALFLRVLCVAPGSCCNALEPGAWHKRHGLCVAVRCKAAVWVSQNGREVTTDWLSSACACACGACILPLSAHVQNATGPASCINLSGYRPVPRPPTACPAAAGQHVGFGTLACALGRDQGC